MTAVSAVDVVVVSFNSRSSLRGCVSPLLNLDDVRVIVVDNASPDRSPDVVADLPIELIRLDRNGGFAQGCNVGWRSGSGASVLFLNPDARIDPRSLGVLVDALDRDPALGAVAPKLLHDDGSLEFSLRRFPRLRSTYARALFLHRIFPRADWTDEIVRDERVYDSPGTPEWASGACLLARRTALEALEGLDEQFFMYSEDIDLCRRLHEEGFGLRYEPEAVVVHEGGVSAPRSGLLPTLADSRIRYTRKHRGPRTELLERLGIALESLIRIFLARGGRAARAGHAGALKRALTPARHLRTD